MSFNLFSCRVSPTSDECRKTMQVLRDMMEFFYRIRFKPIPIEPPGPGPLPPRPGALGLARISEPFNFIAGELLLDAVADPNPRANMPALVTDIRKSGIYGEVVQKVIGDFGFALKTLKKEAELLKNTG